MQRNAPYRDRWLHLTLLLRAECDPNAVSCNLDRLTVHPGVEAAAAESLDVVDTWTGKVLELLLNECVSYEAWLVVAAASSDGACTVVMEMDGCREEKGEGRRRGEREAWQAA